MGSRRLIAAVCAASTLLAVGMASAAPRHTGILRTPAAASLGRMRGVVPAGRPARPSQFAGHGLGSSNLQYHGGPVMATNATYTIFWGPSSGFAPGYEATINKFLGDVAAQSGTTSNVYATDTQYYGPNLAPISYLSNYVQSFADTTTPIPANDCGSQYSGTGVTVSGCVVDTDIQAEIARVIAAHSLPEGLGTEYFVLTPANVGSCFDTSSGECSYSWYCAYHSNYYDGATPVLYANMPYTDTSGVGAPGACDVGQHPNGNQADATINVLSHEHNETITDPLGTAWWDSSGNENGDKCAWNFGSVLGSTASGEFNQVINNDFYWLQQEWSNASSGCVQHYGALLAPSGVSVTPSSGAPGTTVTITGSNLNDAYRVSFNGAAATSFQDVSGSISATVPANATTGPVSVTTVGGTASSATFTVGGGGGGGGGDFGLGGSPSSLSVNRGGTARYTITVTDTSPFSGSVSLSVKGLPSRSSASFSPNPATATSTLTVTTNRHTPSGTYALTITGTSGSLTHTATVTLKVN